MTYRIVVIEDDPGIRAMLCDLLEGRSFSVVSFDRPSLIDTLSPQDPPALFVIDLGLPGMSGVDIARQLRERGFSTSPMIAVSASCLLRKMAEASQLFVAVLPKPFDTHELLTAIEEQVGRVQVWGSREPHLLIPSMGTAARHKSGLHSTILQADPAKSTTREPAAHSRSKSSVAHGRCPRCGPAHRTGSVFGYGSSGR